MRRKHLTGMLGASMLVLACGSGDQASDIKSEFQPSLGSGVNYSETKTFRTCIASLEVENAPLNIERLFNEKRITSKEELHKTLNIDVSASAKGLWGDGGGSAAFFNDTQINQDAFYWLVDADYSVSSQKIRMNDVNFALTPEAKEILKSYGLQAFYDACGTHFYSGKKTGGRYTMLYEFTSREDKVVEKLNTKASYGGFGMDTSAAFKSFLESAKKASVVKVKSHIAGGGPEIADYEYEPEKLKEALAQLRRDIVEKDQGVVTEWYLSAYTMFPEILEAQKENPAINIDDRIKNDVLSELYNLYSDNASMVVTLQSRISKAQQEEPIYVYSPETLAEMNSIIEQYRLQNEEISERAKLCLRDEECKTSGLNRIQAEIPAPDQDFSHTGDWRVSIGIDIDRPWVTAGNSNGEWAEFISDGSFYVKENHPQSGTNHFLELKYDSENGQVTRIFGDLYQVIHPDTGKRVTNACIGQYESICNFRIVTKELSNGTKTHSLIIAVFDENGFIQKVFKFNNSNI